jgi:excinuclease UvrABC helicase subunit UvrB
MKKIYLFDLFDLFSNSWKLDESFLKEDKNLTFPKDGDKNWDKTCQELETDTHLVKKEIWISTDGTKKYIKTTSESKARKVDVSLLESELKQAIEREDYEKACQLRDQIRNHKKSGS